MWLYLDAVALFRVKEGGMEDGKAFGYFKGEKVGVGVGPGLRLGSYIR